jgi:hypothetical protein
MWFIKYVPELCINYQLDAQIIYSYNITFLYTFRATNAHLQEGTLYTCSIWYACYMYTMCPPEDEHLWLETFRGM